MNGLAEKMVRRQPHVFGKEEYISEEQNKLRWEEIKRAEREEKNRRKMGQAQGIQLDKQ